MVQAIERIQAPALAGRYQATRAQTHESTRCAILTRSGSLLARGRVADRAPEHVGAAYELKLTEVAPPGALEALFHANQPEVVLRAGREAELALRIDHITGPPAGRTFWLQPVGG